MKKSTLNLIPLALLLLLALRSEGQLLSNFTGFNSGTGFDNAVRAIAEQSDGKLIVGGQFSTYKGVTVNGICRLLQNGDLDTTFVNTVNGFTGVEAGLVLSLKVLPDDRILVGGEFNVIGGQIRFCIARLNKNGSLDVSFNPNFLSTVSPKQVYAIEILPDGTYAFGGIHVNGNNNIGLCSPTGVVQSITSLSGTGNAITDLKNYPGNRLLVSGTFGASGNRFIDRINLSNWTSDPSFAPYYQTFQANGFNARINTMHVLADGRIIIGGDFTFFAQSTLGQATAGRLARLDTNGRFDGTYAVGNGFNGRVWQITPAPAALGVGNLIVCGEFTSYNSTTTNRLAVISPTATLVNSGNYANNLIYTAHVTRTENFIVSGGTFTNFNSTTQNRLSVINASTCLKPTFLNYPSDQFITLGSARVLQASVLPQTVSDFTWFKNGSFNSFTIASTSSSLSIPSFSLTDTGLYRVDLSGTCGATTGPGFRLRLITAPVLNPLPADTNICQNSSVSITASAIGLQLNFAWFKGSTQVSSNATLVVNNFVINDTGVYKVVVSNVAGSDSAFIRLIRPQNPQINLITSSASTACLGDTVIFQVQATGFNLSYAWQKGFSNIAGATSSTYMLNGVNSASFGIGTSGYRVVVTDGCNNPTSSPFVNLTQRSTPPTPFINGSSTICPAFPDTVVYSTGSTAAVYQWTLPSGWSGTSSLSSISVLPGSSGGAISLRVRDTACFSAPATRIIGAVNPARLDSGLVRYWSFNQQDSLRDLVAGVTGTLAGAASQDANAISSSSNTIRFTTTAPLAASVPTTVVIRLTSLFNSSFGNFVTFIGSNETVLPAGHPVLVLNTTGRLQAWSNAGAAIGTGTLLGAGVPYTIVLTRNGGNFKLHLNGTAVDSGTNISQAPIGRFFNNRPGFETQGLRGGADEVRIYNRVLSNEEVLLLSEAPIVSGPWRYAPSLCPGSSINSSITLTSTPNTYQWSINGLPQAGATTSSFNVPSLPATDTLISVTARSGCALLTLNRRPSFLAAPSSAPITGPDTICALTATTFQSTVQSGAWSIPGAPVPQNPVVRYTFDGTRNNATSGNGAPLLLNPANIFAQPLGQYVADKHGAAGKAYRFTQTSEAMRSAGTNLPASLQPTTWSFWFRNTSNGDKAYLMYNQTSASIQTVYIYRRNGQIGVSNSRDFNQGQRIQFNLPYDTQWHHLVVTINNLNVTTLYIDSVQRATGTISFAHSGLNTYLIGQGDNINTAAGAPCDFEIDELVLYNSVLTQSQVGQLYTNSHNGLYSDFVSTFPPSISQGFTSNQTIQLTRVNGTSGCSTTVSKALVVNPLPIVNISLSGGVLTASSAGATDFQWFRNDTLIAGATSATFQPTQSGQYSARATAANGCENTSARFSFTITGFDEENVFSNLAVYPNPFENELKLDLPVAARYRLLNLLGKEVASGQLLEGNSTLQTEGLVHGTYLLMLQSGDRMHTIKVIK